MKLGIFLPNWIGDAVIATPTLRALRNHFERNATLIGIMKPYVAPVYEGTSLLDEQWLYDDVPHPSAVNRWDLVRRISETELDAIVLLTNSFGTALMAWLGGAKQRIGYRRDFRAVFLTTALPPPAERGRLIPYPLLDYYLRLAHTLGCSRQSPALELSTTAADELAADQAWHELELREDGRVVTFNSSGAFGDSKLWPVEYCAELTHRLAAELDHDVLVLCGPNERSRAAQIAYTAGCNGVKSLASQRVSIGLSKACVRRSRLLVSTDSGPRYFAPAFDVPLVSLSGPTHTAWGDTHYQKEVRLQVPVECGPCEKPSCPLRHHRCMRELTVDMVFRAVSDLLEKTTTTRRDELHLPHH